MVTRGLRGGRGEGCGESDWTGFILGGKLVEGVVLAWRVKGGGGNIGDEFLRRFWGGEGGMIQEIQGCKG